MKPKTKEEDEAEVMLAIRRSRIALLADHPFYGDLAMKMPIKIDSTLPMPTAATDGETLFYHPDFVKSLTPQELIFVTGHEVLHAALLHCQRRGNKDDRYPLAIDIVVNQLLVNSGVGEKPKDCIYDPYLFEQGEGLVEKIYDLLKPDDKRKAMDDLVLPGAGKPDPNAAAKWRARIAQAQEVAKACGNMPGNLETLLDQGGESTVAWEDELFSEITADKGEDFTYSKRNRRYAALDVLLPGRYGEKMGDLVFAIDCSGSTSDDMVQRCGAEIERAKRLMRPERTHVIYWDTNIKKHDIYEADDEMDINVYGRGGTDPTCIWKYVEEQGIEVAHCIVATDLEFCDFGAEPDYPVIWCAMETNRNSAPFGKVIQADA